MITPWATLDLRTGDRRGSADADRPVYSASVIKLPVLTAVLLDVDRGRLALTDELAIDASHRVGGSGWLTASGRSSATVETLARAMIDSSDNTATNVLLDAVGFPAVATAIAASGMRATVQARHMMDLVARAAGRENLITAHDACAALAALTTGTLLTPASQGLAASALRDQRTPGVLPSVIPPGYLLGHKTGELDGVRHDTGVLWRDGVAVAAVAVLGVGEPGNEDAVLEATREVACVAVRAVLAA